MLECKTVSKTKEARRLDKLKDESRNLAKRYKLPEAALTIIERAGRIHGQQSRAIQVAVELLWAKVGWAVPDNAMSAILDSPTSSRPGPSRSLKRSRMSTGRKVKF